MRMKIAQASWRGAALLLLVLLGAFEASAQQPVPEDIADAIAYLAATQQGDGSYAPLHPLTGTYHTTARVAQTLARVPTSTSEFSAALAFLTGQVVGTVEERARRVMIGGTASDASDLLAAQNADGGFGSEAGLASNVLDTALAVTALEAAGVPTGIVARDVVVPGGSSVIFSRDIPADGLTLDIVIETIAGTVDVRIGGGAPPGPADLFFRVTAGHTTISIHPGSDVPLVPGMTHFIEFSSAAGATLSFRVDYTAASGDTTALTDALAYLQEARNADGGWGFQPTDEDSRLYYTYWAAMALGPVVDTSAFVLGRELPGGGMADSGAANVFDTALGLAALAVAQRDPASMTPDSLAFLEAAQLGNGSFADDPYRTALALDALLASRPPLAPVIASNGGAGVGADFLTDLAQARLSGVAPLGATGMTVNVAGAEVSFDAATGQYTITVPLLEGVNTILISAMNSAGVAGLAATIRVTRDTSLSGQEVAVAEGFNAIGLTLVPANGLDAVGLLELLGPEALQIQRLDTTTGLFERLERNGDTGFSGANFPLGALDGLYLLASGASTTRVVGSQSTAATVDLPVGVNTVVVPNPPLDLDAYELLGLIGDETVVSALQRFAPTSGAFETAVYDGGVPAGMNFPIESGVAYQVFMLQDRFGFQLPVALTVSITNPADGATVTSTPITVSGLVTGVAPVAVTVNGVPATVAGGTFAASIPLMPGANTITAEAVDAVSPPVTEVITLTLQAVDYRLPPGGSVQDARVFSADQAILDQTASITEARIGIPDEIDYQPLGFSSVSPTEIQVDFRLDVVPGASPGIYTFAVEYGLLDGNNMPLGPLVGNVFDFRVEVTP